SPHRLVPRRGGRKMIPAAASTNDRARDQTRPGSGIVVTAALMALWCIGFALVNIVYERTGHFAGGPYAEYASALTVMNWLVVVLKGVGAVVALLSVTNRPTVAPPAVVSVLVWGAFATLGVYALGSVAQAAGMASGLRGASEQVTIAGLGYVSLFLLGAAGFGVLAIPHSQRHRVRRRFAVLGVLLARVVLGGVLLVVPPLLAALGLMPTT